ncbi:hypothetical protein Avbf_00190 [Armadillidium vulgare]|nr:hypothetical protein Avbf_00190 [Armadillidium vulgare]
MKSKRKNQAKECKQSVTEDEQIEKVIKVEEVNVVESFEVEEEKDIDEKEMSHTGESSATSQNFIVNLNNVKEEREDSPGESSSGYESTLHQEVISQMLASVEDLNEHIASAIVRQDPSNEELLYEEPISPDAAEEKFSLESGNEDELDEAFPKPSKKTREKSQKTRSSI